MNKWVKQKVLMVVKTYPTPSSKYYETVCTAGITEDGNWIRLYPIKFRDLQDEQKFSKYTWIEVETTKPSDDKRPESYKVNDESIRIISHLTPQKCLVERMKLMLPQVKKSLEVISDEHETLGTSLGIFKPKKVIDLIITPTDKDWDEGQRNLLSQLSIFDYNNPKRVLEKIPWEFRFKYICDDERCNGHNMKILDWEIYQTYRHFKYQYKNEETALKYLKDKWLNIFNNTKNDSYFITGTVHRYKKFIIIGYFSCPRFDYEQLSLF